MKINLIPKVISIFMLFVSGCSFAPGMHMTTDSTWLDDNQTVYIESIDKDIPIININNSFKANQSNIYKYEIGTGDQIAITVWGLQDIFPLSGINTELNLTNGWMKMVIFSFHMLDWLKHQVRPKTN